MKKEEYVLNAWGEFKEEIRHLVDKDGFVPYSWAPELFFKDNSIHATGRGKDRKVRPLSLDNFEKNNGWILILFNTEKPTVDTPCYFYFRDEKYRGTVNNVGRFNCSIGSFGWQTISCYYPILDPPEPLFKSL